MPIDTWFNCDSSTQAWGWHRIFPWRFQRSCLKISLEISCLLKACIDMAFCISYGISRQYDFPRCTKSRSANLVLVLWMICCISFADLNTLFGTISWNRRVKDWGPRPCVSLYTSQHVVSFLLTSSQCILLSVCSSVVSDRFSRWRTARKAPFCADCSFLAPVMKQPS